MDFDDILLKLADEKSRITRELDRVEKVASAIADLKDAQVARGITMPSTKFSASSLDDKTSLNGLVS